MKKLLLLSAAISCTFISFAQLPQPAVPIACNTNNCTPPLSETCTGNSSVVTSFTSFNLRIGSANTVGAMYTFYNVATVGIQQINATITIDGTLNANVDNIDDNGGGGVPTSYFAPRIVTNTNFGSADRNGYAQFTIRFFQSNGTAGEQYTGLAGDDYSTVAFLSGLNYIHYDVDGTDVGSTGGWFRETGLVKNVGGVLTFADASTELVPYTYTDGGFNWKGFAGSVCERTGVSNCAQVAVSANYPGLMSAVTVRMGYDYNYNGTVMSNPPAVRQYGSRFGCFTFPQQQPLPVSLKNFTAIRSSNSAASVKWETVTEQNNSGFVIERNLNGVWEEVAFVPTIAAGGNSNSLLSYSYSDPNNSKNMSQYRLRQVDIDSKVKYSEIRSVKGVDQKGGVILYPNPSNDGKINIVFENKNEVRDVAVSDMGGRVVKQLKAVSANSVVIDNLVSGMYTIRITVPATGEQVIEKVIVNKH
jgi:hypothetical protein